MPCCDIWDVFGDLLIKEYTYWKLFVRNRNTTLGNCVAITKRHMESLSDITCEEMGDFAVVVRDVERALHSAFEADRVNYLALMMKDRHVHFHIIPRYAGPRDFAGRVWSDDGWPGPPGPRKAPVSSEILNRVKEELVKYVV